MKKILVFFFAIVLFVTPHVAFALDTKALQAVIQTPVEYDLPYPGTILPDSIIYPLKTLRDKIVSFFITDAQKQAEFDLLQADKRLAAGEYLLREQHPNTALVSETVSKGENYFQDAIVNITQAKKEGRLVNDFLEKLTKADKKHQQVLYQMTQQTHGQLKEDLFGDIEIVQKFAQQVNNLKSH